MGSQAPCPEAKGFIDVSQAPSLAGAKPVLQVECTEQHIVVRSNGIPSFRYVQTTPTPLRLQTYVWRIPRQPRPAPEPRQVPLLGPIAVAVDGLPIFGPNEAPEHGTADPYLDKILDYCNGHTAQRGDYHFHVRPNCLFDKIDGRVSLVIGYAFDGYPILAPFECADASCASVRKVTSSWRRESSNRNAWSANRYVEGHGTLDRCNGMVRPDGSYAYYATDTFPYFLACYRGIVDNDQRMEGRPFGKGPPPKGGPK
jgi:arylsulfate sulfotransferase